ncbi:MAG TPA: hypothetical protein VHM92_02640 [Allosphingosinicella sp.]|nr:hypothetical protein [Allosphingosinicella sp.]
MDLGGAGWIIIDIVAVAALAGVLLFALSRNRRARGDAGRTEAATRDLYREEEAARRREDDDGA